MAGVTPAMVKARLRSGRLRSLHRSVYAIGYEPLRREGRWMAAVLAPGPGAVLSHRDAAVLHDLRGSEHQTISVTTRCRRTDRPGLRIHHTSVLDRADVTTVHGIPVTSIARTLLDLASTTSPDEVVRAMRTADRLRLLHVAAIEDVLWRTRGRRGLGHTRLRGALAEHRALGTVLTRSALEDRFLAVVVDARLPKPTMNAFVAGMEVDALWHAERVAVELDGYAYHRTLDAFQRDRAKGTALAIAGYVVLRYTHDDIARRAPDVIAGIGRALAAATRACERDARGGR